MNNWYDMPSISSLLKCRIRSRSVLAVERWMWAGNGSVVEHFRFTSTICVISSPYMRRRLILEGKITSPCKSTTISHYSSPPLLEDGPNYWPWRLSELIFFFFNCLRLETTFSDCLYPQNMPQNPSTTHGCDLIVDRILKSLKPPRRSNLDHLRVNAVRIILPMNSWLLIHCSKQHRHRKISPKSRHH